jgi:hypothetical protein
MKEFSIASQRFEKKTAITNLRRHLKNQHRCVVLAEMEVRGSISRKNDMFLE